MTTDQRWTRFVRMWRNVMLRRYVLLVPPSPERCEQVAEMYAQWRGDDAT